MCHVPADRAATTPELVRLDEGPARGLPGGVVAVERRERPPEELQRVSGAELQGYPPTTTSSTSGSGGLTTPAAVVESGPAWPCDGSSAAVAGFRAEGARASRRRGFGAPATACAAVELPARSDVEPNATVVRSRSMLVPGARRRWRSPSMAPPTFASIQMTAQRSRGAGCRSSSAATAHTSAGQSRCACGLFRAAAGGLDLLAWANKRSGHPHGPDAKVAKPTGYDSVS